jgi:hypothetical protein
VTVTETVTSFDVSTQVITTTILETITAPATLALPVAIAASSSSTESFLGISPASTADASPDAITQSAFRERGIPATPYQRQLACNSTSNIVRNPNFQQNADDGSVPGWDIDNTDPNISIENVDDGNATIAQFSSAEAGRQLTVTQAMTLCPGQEYDFSCTTEQASTLAGCNVTFSMVAPDGSRTSILTVEPSEDWTTRNATFTAGNQPEADMEIAARCDGHQGIAVTDQEGWMRVEVQGVRLQRDEDE